MHQCVKFQYSLAMGGRVTDDLANYSCPILRGIKRQMDPKGYVG